VLDVCGGTALRFHLYSRGSWAGSIDSAAGRVWSRIGAVFPAPSLFDRISTYRT
jgi:hypothetical protein